MPVRALIGAPSAGGGLGHRLACLCLETVLVWIFETFLKMYTFHVKTAPKKQKNKTKENNCIAPCHTLRPYWASDTHYHTRELEETSDRHLWTELGHETGFSTATSPWHWNTHMLCVQRLNWINISFTKINVYFSSSWDNWITVTTDNIRTTIWTLLWPMQVCNIYVHHHNTY